MLERYTRVEESLKRARKWLKSRGSFRSYSSPRRIIRGEGIGVGR